MRYWSLSFVAVSLLLGCTAVLTPDASREGVEGVGSGFERGEFIRVLVVNGAEELKIQGALGEGPFLIKPLSHGKVTVNGRLYRPPLRFSPKKEFIYVNKMSLRGTIEVVYGDGGDEGRLQVIDEVPLERYLVGLINAEISSKWHDEAIKAQAVVARTYAVYQKRKRADAPFHLTNTNLDQVYIGANAEDMAAFSAVRDTAGEILSYRGEPALAVYHSNAGGQTEAAKEVWGADYPYLKAVKSPYDRSAPSFSWELSISGEALGGLLRKAGYNIGDPVHITTKERSSTGRVKSLEVRDRSGGSLMLPGEHLRKAVGYAALRSTLFNVKRVGGGFVFKGRGSGHGVGLSQWGAKGMAEKGFNYTLILRHFYPGTRLVKVY
jgi:stage II sporulation protein D